MSKKSFSLKSIGCNYLLISNNLSFLMWIEFSLLLRAAFFLFFLTLFQFSFSAIPEAQQCNTPLCVFTSVDSSVSDNISLVVQAHSSSLGFYSSNIMVLWHFSFFFFIQYIFFSMVRMRFAK